MAFLDARQYESEDDISGRSTFTLGRYHVTITDAKETVNKKGIQGVTMDFQAACEGISPDGKTRTTGQAGKTMPAFFGFRSEKGDEASKSCIERVTRLALCAGVLRAGEACEPDWKLAIGREMVIEIIQGDEYKDANGQTKPGNPQLNYLGFWSLGNKAVADVPKEATTPGMRYLAKNGGLTQPTSQAGNKPAVTGLAPANGQPKRSLRDLL